MAGERTAGFQLSGGIPASKCDLCLTGAEQADQSFSRGRPQCRRIDMAIAPLSVPPAVKRGGCRVLFADDDPGIRAIVRMNLEAEGFEVTVVEDGDNAIIEAERLLPDLI